MRSSMIAVAVALAAWAGPAAALKKPDASTDPRIRSVTADPGDVILLVAARGKTLMLAFPPGEEVHHVNVSDQDVMDQTILAEEDPMRSTPPGNRPSTPGAENVVPCNVTANLQYCVRRERFLALKPVTELTEQPLAVVTLRARPNAEPAETTYVFQLETAPVVDNAAYRVADASGTTRPPTRVAYYSVRIDASAPPPRPVAAPGSAAVVRTAPRRPRAYSLPAQQSVAVAPPAPVVANRAYEVQGDRALVGAQ